ncbi:SAM hydrolase/SAM-dependent halogenase family protein [Halobiforma nitratireducens]|uniref:NAD operon protein n=1 Tax=Halobiforma nitratireducens JCM 10879 TaxID=1227454 RepID=M0M8Z4_9EURY|nr:SAM-dependent chlorinase/fluorinase [Halobiforma nitratireducens]EMA41818.1 NAD operon protein [Halobiforma nitratireducens JCM 10879]
MITIATDFGSPYPAAMKGVLCQRTDARLVDVAHDFPRQDVRAAAFWLREVLPYFPPATHLVVVDPGVGTDRNAIVVRAGDHVLVGPDNGVLLPAARRLAPADDREGYVIEETRLESVEPTGTGTTPRAALGSDDDDGGRDRDRGPASNTFHGRDVFAPAAAAVHDADHETLAELSVLRPAEASVDLTLPEPTLEPADSPADADRAVGEVLVVDDFGNAITNVPGPFLADRDRIEANGEVVPVGETFAAVGVGERLATVGSHGYVELDVNQGRGDDAFGLSAGDRVVLERVDDG